MDSRTRFIIRRCFEKGYTVRTAADLSECSEETVKVLYRRFDAACLKRYEQFIAKAEPIGE